MPWSSAATITPHDFARALRRHPARWLFPAVLLGAVATAYAVLRPATWSASQTMIVRDEAGGSLERPGKFREIKDMKTLQETVLELAKSQAVLESALKKAGPPADRAPGVWPTKRDVADLQGQLKLSPPKGAEFGATEVFYLVIESTTRDRAVTLTTAIANELQIHLQELRKARAQSLIDELSRSVELARTDLDVSTARVSEIEKTVGRDLAELRILQESPSGDSQLRRTVTEVESELRTHRAAQQANQEMLNLLKTAQKDATSLLAAPTRLLEAQPAVRRLKEGLIDAQLRTAQLRGTMSDRHPLVLAAETNEAEVREGLHDEIEIAIRGVDVDQRVTAGRVQSLEAQLAEATERMNRLASVRASYGNVVSENRHCTDILKAAQTELADSRASLAAAAASSLISKIGAPDTGPDPVGPGKAMIVLCGAAGGLLLGLAFVFLTAQPAPTSTIVTTSGQPAPAPEVVRPTGAIHEIKTAPAARVTPAAVASSQPNKAEPIDETDANDGADETDDAHLDDVYESDEVILASPDHSLSAAEAAPPPVAPVVPRPRTKSAAQSVSSAGKTANESVAEVTAPRAANGGGRTKAQAGGKGRQNLSLKQALSKLSNRRTSGP